ncbi:MAG: SDR family oxidoreductase [Chloroflexota bacterium]
MRPTFLDLSGKRALVTGGGVGLGHHMALGLAEAGADLILVGRRKDKLDAAADEARAMGVAAETIAADVTVEADLQRIAAEAGRVDILVNNAGIGLLRPWDQITPEEWRGIFSINVDALWRLCQLLAPGMVERGWGRIVNIASIYGIISGDPAVYPGMDWDNPAYVVSKHAVEGITHYLGTRLAQHGVSVNSICPGMFPSEQQSQPIDQRIVDTISARTPAGRVGRFDDLKAAVVFLSSPGAAFVSGQNVVVDGGWSVW